MPPNLPLVGFIADKTAAWKGRNSMKNKYMLSLMIALVVALSFLHPALSKEVPSPDVPETPTLSPVTTVPQETPVASVELQPILQITRVNNDITAENILLIVNEKRQEFGLSPLVLDDRLETTAQNKSDDMVTRDYFAHADPDGNKVWPKVIANGYNYYVVGENLAYGFTDVEVLMDAWMLSEKHRKNILDPRFKDFGVGITYDELGYGVITTLFGTE